MPGSSFVSGLLGGFGQSLASSRKAAADEADKKAAREDAILQHLATSTDPEIQRAAIVGLTTPGPRKKGFLDNLIGAPAPDHPALGHIASLINMGREVPEVPAGADIPVHEGLGAPPPAAPQPLPASASAAMPATSGAQAPPPASRLPSPSPIQPSLASAPIAGSIPGTPAIGAHREPRQVFRTPDQQAAATTTAQMQAKQKFVLDNGGSSEMAKNLAVIEAGGGALFAQHNLPGLIPASSALGEHDESGHVIDQTDVAAGKRYRQTTSVAGGATLREEAAPVTSTKPYPITAMVDLNSPTHERDMSGSSQRQGRYLYNPSDKTYQFMGLTTPGPRDQAFPFQWDDDQGVSHREVVYAEPRFTQGAGTPPPTEGGGSGTPPPAPSAQATTPPPGPPAAAAGPNTKPPTPRAPQAAQPPQPTNGITRVQVGATPAANALAYARMPSGAVVPALQNPKTKKLFDPKTSAEMDGAIPATAAEAAKHQEAVSGVSVVSAALDDLTQLVKKVYPAGSGLLGGLAAGASIAVKSLRSDKDLADLRSTLKTTAGPVARIVDMANRMSLPMVKQAVDALGTPDAELFHTDSQEAALQKVQAVRDALERQVEQLGIVIDPQGQPHQFATREQLRAFKAQRDAWVAAHPGGQ